VHNNTDKLGKIIKTARKNNNLTREQLVEKINITARYLMSIENENKKPSYNVLFNLVHELGIPQKLFFSLKNYMLIPKLNYLSSYYICVMNGNSKLQLRQ